MKTYGGLWDRLVSWENLLLAAQHARRRKRARPDVRRFEFAAEWELVRLARELEDGSYRPGGFRTHWITRPKPRLISAAPYRDRVVHHAIMNVLEPILERHFHPHSYACRKGKGTHAAADRLQRLMGRRRYVLQCDIARFFPSIDHAILKATFRRLIRDRRVLELMDLIVDSSNPQEPVKEYFEGDELWTPDERRRGIPIGNLTSQWFANWALNDLDHFVTSELGFGDYVRYCDDFVILADDRRRLWGVLLAVRGHLASRRLCLNERRVAIRPVGHGVQFVGYRTWSSHRLLRKSNVKDFRRRARWMRRAYARGEVEWAEIRPRIVSWFGHARQADSVELLRRLEPELVFVRGNEAFRGRDGAELTCSARRQLEQQPAELPIGQSQQEHAQQPQQQQRVSCCPALTTDGWRPGMARPTGRASVAR